MPDRPFTKEILDQYLKELAKEYRRISQKAYAGERNNQVDQQGIGWLLQLLRNHGQYTDVR